MTKTRKLIFFLLPILFLLFLILPSQAQALQIETRNLVVIEKDKVLENNFYAIGKKVEIKGQIKGDLLVIGQNIEISGEIEGDALLIGGDIVISGTINGSARILGENLTLDGLIEKNLMFAGNNIVIKEEAKINWEALLLTQVGEINGEIGRDLNATAVKLNLLGTINGSAKLRLSQNKNLTALTVADQATIKENLFYKAGQKGEISPRADIRGETGFSVFEVPAKSMTEKLWRLILSIFSSLLIGLVLVTLWKKPIKSLTDKLLAKPLPLTGLGILTLLLTPILVVFLLVTIIGIPLALLILSIWFIAIFLSRVIVAIAIGRKILESSNYKNASLKVAMIAGVVVSWAVFSLPLIGWFFSLLAIVWGLGGIIAYFKK